MSRVRPSSPDPVSSYYRGSRPQTYYDKSPYHRYVHGKERDSRDYRNRSPSPQPAETRDAYYYRQEIRERDSRPYPPSPPARHIRDTYYPDRLRMEAELEHYRAREDILRSTYQQQQIEAQIRKEVEQDLKLQLEQRRSAREEAKKELEQARLDAENTARKKLETERKARKALREREAEQAKRIESAIRLRLDTEREAEEADKRAKARMEENLELLMKTRMVEKFDDLMETARVRLQLKESLRPSKNAAPREGESKNKGFESYTIVDHDIPYSERPPQPRPGMSACRAHETALYKPERDTLTPSEDEWDPNHGHIPLAVPDPPSFEFDSEEEIPPDFTPKPRCTPFHRNSSHVHQTVVSPDLVQQIAYAVADILRGPEHEDVMSERSNYTDLLRHYLSRATGDSPNPNRNFSGGDQFIENRSPSHERYRRKRQKHVARDLVAASPHKEESERLPNFSRPRSENSASVLDFKASGLTGDSHPPNNNKNNNKTLVERLQVQIASSDVQGLSTGPIGDEGYRNINDIGAHK